MSLAIKTGARVGLTTPRMVLAALIIEGAYADSGIPLCTLTAGLDGKHMASSKHYTGDAWDVRINNVPPEKLEPLRKLIAERLGADFDVVLESDHFHVEFDPKTPYGA